jgi:hypothetical protein
MNCEFQGMPDLAHRSRIAIALFVLLATVIGAASVFQTIHRFRNIPFQWDPAAYASDGLICAKDLKAGDLISFVGDTYGLGWRPFFHAWLLAPAFILFGNTFATARLVSLLCFMFFVPVIYAIGLEMSPRHGPWIGLITACLVLTSAPILGYSAMCMEEIPGLLMTFLTFLFYMKAMKTRKSGFFIVTSILMALTLFTKWHHGVFVIFAVVMTQVSVDKRILSRNNRSLFVPFLVFMLGWFAYPRHILSFYGHSTFQPHYYRFLSLENWLYYPKSFLHVYHASVIVALIMAAGFLFSLRNVRDPKVRLLAWHVLIGLVLMAVKLDHRHRYILSIIPSIWILGASQIVVLASHVRGRWNNRMAGKALAAVGILGFCAGAYLVIPRVYRNYPDSLLKYEFYCNELQNEAYEFIARNVGGHNQISVFGSWDYFNSLRGATIRWSIEVERDRDRWDRANNKKMAAHYFSQWLKNRNRESYDHFVRFLENKNVNVHEYHLLSFMKNLNEEAYQEFRAKAVIEPFSDRITDVTNLSKEIGRLITVCKDGESDINAYASQFMRGQKEWRETASRRFLDLGIVVTIYDRERGPAAAANS